MRKMSYSRGKGKLRHNNRDMISANVDKDRIADNIIIKQQELAAAYEQVFGAALEEYNAKQKRSDRKIDNYFYKLFGREPTDVIIENSNKQHSFYEYVVGIGDMHDTGYKSNPKMAALAVRCLEEYMQNFQERNPQFYVFNAVIHQDEATPHLHYDFIPYVEGCRTGMSRQQGIAKALEQMGYGKGENAIRKFTENERNVFREICEKNGIEVAPEEKGREKTYTSQQYRELQEQVDNLKSEREHLVNDLVQDFLTGGSKKKVAAAEKIIENAVSVNDVLCIEGNERIAAAEKKEEWNSIQFRQLEEKANDYNNGVRELNNEKIKFADYMKKSQEDFKQHIKRTEASLNIKARTIAEEILKKNGYVPPSFDVQHVLEQEMISKINQNNIEKWKG